MASPRCQNCYVTLKEVEGFEVSAWGCPSCDGLFVIEKGRPVPISVAQTNQIRGADGNRARRMS